MPVMRFVTLIAAGLLCVSAPAAARAQGTRGPYRDVKKLPADPAGRRITELLEVINANDPARVEAFVKDAFTPEFRDFAPMDAHLSVFANVYNQSRGLEFYAIRQYQEPAPEGEIVVVVRNKLTRAWQALVIDLEADPPHRFAGLQFAPARPPSDLPPAGKLTDQQMARELEAFVAQLAQADAFSGAVLLARHGQVLYQRAFGQASKRYGVSNRTDTKFNLGSMNKMFTAVAIMQLLQRGQLSLDDPLSRFVQADWLPADVGDKIRIEHLLTHTSGLGSYFNEMFMNSSRALFRELEDYKPLIANSTLAFEPGTDWRYSNTGMFLLGVVIERASGQNYFDYVGKQITGPAGMINTDCYAMDHPVPNLAIGYSREQVGGRPEWVNNLYKHVIRGGPAGGGFSTVEDLLRFDVALRHGKLLSLGSTRMMWSPRPELNSPNYGYGFAVQTVPGDRIVGHGGGFAGISSNLDMFLDSGFTAVVLSNYDGGAHAVSEKMRELIGRRHDRPAD